MAIHADHYGMKNEKDLGVGHGPDPHHVRGGHHVHRHRRVPPAQRPEPARQPGRNPKIPAWAGLETEIGEIKGSTGLSTPDEALFLIQGLNAHGIFADWIALNNGTTHGIEASDVGIEVALTAEVHEALAPYNVSGAQHGTSGNSSDRLRETAERRTRPRPMWPPPSR